MHCAKTGKTENGRKPIKIILVHYLILADFFKKCAGNTQRYGMLCVLPPWWPLLWIK
jgi:hypothetical protein